MGSVLIRETLHQFNRPAAAMPVVDWIKKSVKYQLGRQGFSIRRLSELTQLADRFGSDKGTCLSAHLYTRVYEKFFNDLRHRPICLLEIGLFRSDMDGRRTVYAVEGKSDARAFQ